MAGIHGQLQAAVQRCSIRGLTIASNWAAEQLLGCPEHNQIDEDEELVQLFDLGEAIPAREVGLVLMGSSLLPLGEYQRCASLFVDATSKELKVSSQLAIFLHAYAQYMAGEKLLARTRKETSKTLMDGADDKKIKPRVDSAQRNGQLPFLHQMLRALHQKQPLDGFLLYLYAMVTVKYYDQYGKPLTGAINAYEIYKQAVCMYPWNWSCWMDLAIYCLESHRPVPTFQDLQAVMQELHSRQYAPAAPEQVKLMHAFFITHVFLEKHRGDLALQVLKGLHSSFPSSLYLYTQIGVAYYSQRLYDRAQDCFDFVRVHDPHRLHHIDTFSNILYVKEKTAELSHLAHEVMKIEKYSPEVCCVVGNYYSLKGQHDKAVLYFQRALSLHPDYLAAWTLMGHEYVELHNIANAIACYRNAIAIYSYDYRPWYGLGQTYEILHLYQYAVYYFNKAATLRPFDARMWSAVGNCLLKLGMKHDAVQVLERAVKAGDREGIATRDLARLYRDDNEEGRAAELYYKYLNCNLFDGEESLPPALPDLASLLHSPAAAEVLANRDWMEASIDSEQAEALLYLALYFHSRCEGVLTEFFCAKLLGFQGPEGDEARVVMKTLRSEVGLGTLSLPNLPRPTPDTPMSPAAFSEPSTGDPYGTLQDSADMSTSRSINKFVLSPASAGKELNISRQFTATTERRRESMGSAMSLGSGPFDPFERYLHQNDDLEAELDLSAQHAEDADADLSLALGGSFDDPDLSAIAHVPQSAAGFPRRSRNVV